MNKFLFLVIFFLTFSGCVTEKKANSDSIKTKTGNEAEQPVTFAKPRLTSGAVRNCTISNAFGSEMMVAVNGAIAGIIPTGTTIGLIMDNLEKTGSAVDFDFIHEGSGKNRCTYKISTALYADSYVPYIRIPEADESLQVAANGVIEAGLVSFSYPIEDSTLSVSATVRTGNRILAVLSPGYPPISCIMPKQQAVALTIDYRWVRGDKRLLLTVPRSEIETDEFIIIPQQVAAYEIPRIGAVSKSHYVRESECLAKLTVINKYEQYNVGLTVSGGPASWQRLNVSEATNTGYSALAPGCQTAYAFLPGTYQISVNKLLRASEILGRYDFFAKAGSSSTLVLGIVDPAIMPDEIANILSNSFQTADIRSSIPEASLYLAVESISGDIYHKSALCGVFGDDGNLKARADITTVLSKINFNNAGSVYLTFTAKCKGFLDDSFSISAESILKAGKGVLSNKFKPLREGADGSIVTYEGEELINTK